MVFSVFRVMFLRDACHGFNNPNAVGDRGRDGSDPPRVPTRRASPWPTEIALPVITGKALYWRIGKVGVAFLAFSLPSQITPASSLRIAATSS